MQTAFGPTGRLSAASAARDGKLYLFGGGATGASGQNEFTDLWVADPVAQTWTRLSQGLVTPPTGKLQATMVGR